MASEIEQIRALERKMDEHRGAIGELGRRRADLVRHMVERHGRQATAAQLGLTVGRIHQIIRANVAA